MSRLARALGALTVAGAGLVAFAGPAHASGESIGACAVEHYEEEHEEGVGFEEWLVTEEGEEAVDSCIEAPNPLLPETNEIIWGSIGFVIVFAFLAKVGYPNIKKGMDARSERIRADLEGAEKAKADADTVLSEYRAQLADAKAEAGRIIEESRQQADALKREQEQRLQSELAAMREKAAADVDAAKAQAIADLRSEVAELAIGAAEVVVGRNLDRATQAQLVEQYIAQVGSRTN